MSGPQSFLRQRSTAKVTEKSDMKDSISPKRREEVVWGKTPGGEGMRVPISTIRTLTIASISCTYDS